MTEHFTELIALSPKVGNGIVGGIASDVEQRAAQDAPKLTGAMATSIYTATHDTSDYAQHVSDAASLRPEVEWLPEVDQPADGQGIVAAAAPYAAEIEYGGVSRPARPFLTTAAESVSQGTLEASAASAINDMLRVLGV